MTLNLKVNRYGRSIYYIIVVIPVLDIVEIDTEIFPIARVEPEI